MTTDHGPADTRSMGIVHSALRRDLERTRIVLTTEPYPDPRRRRGLAEHVLWMMRFLHIHHTGEDVGLWPLIRVKNPDAGALLDQMDADHQRIAPAITALEDAALAYRDDANARQPLLEALAGLTDVLLPHLRREELEMMPVVAATLTTAEYHDVEQEYFVRPKSFLELGAEAHWVIDGLGEDDRELIMHVVPAVPRFILLHGFARTYRRKSSLRWGHGPAAALPSLNLALLEGRS
ncbi:cation-binding protein [Rhodococcus sp. WB1]|uniref:hemerythrin domain-containing protein n=2 Tax=Rhodococcus TaxID=1827 RepID=UPI00039C1833|nr:hemerythrin domain-containing protein [Rhodococcus sp. 11-3]AKE89590.1 cation-binding protein [Rhodococcus aetherivorans]ANZ25686.1 cation-binding protein [Rhodococcus sp. WB1]KDE13684.1 cation-binding protein [Rhodococcus aetherivorans]USC17461.1 hemerythrin domain-containing protein [Rhodococcus sp. 11-3]